MQWSMIPRFERAVCDYFTLGARAAMLTATVNGETLSLLSPLASGGRERCDRAGAGAGGVTVSTTPASDAGPGIPRLSKRRPGPPLAFVAGFFPRRFLTVGGEGLLPAASTLSAAGRGTSRWCPVC